MLYVLFSFDMFCLLFLLLDPIQHGLKFGANVFYYLKFMILEDKSPVYFRIANVSSFLTNLANFLGKSINWWIYLLKPFLKKKIISVFYLWNLLTLSNPYNKFQLPVFPKFKLHKIKTNQESILIRGSYVRIWNAKQFKVWRKVWN